MNQKTIINRRPFGLRRIFSKLCVIVSRWSIFPSTIRISLLRAAGIKIGDSCFIGSNVYFDEMRPELIEIGAHATITTGTHIISHFFDPPTGRFYYGNVKIGKSVFIGMNSLIINAVDISDGAVIAAGSVVNKDIPPDEIWGGNPARFLKKKVTHQK